jgi:hypothetical protein
MDRAFLEIGRLLTEAFEAHRDLYDQWVIECLPFGLNTASRLRACWKASRVLPAETLARLPRPWQAVYALTRLDPAVLVAAVESGEVHPAMTVAEARAASRALSGRETLKFSEVDLMVGRIVRQDRALLGAAARELLVEWLHDGVDASDRPRQRGAA